MSYFNQVPLLSNQISLIRGSRIIWLSLSCQQFRSYSYQILGQALPHDTKFSNSRDKIVDSRGFPSWSLIHGSSWSGLLKVEPGSRPMRPVCARRQTIVFQNGYRYITHHGLFCSHANFSWSIVKFEINNMGFIITDSFEGKSNWKMNLHCRAVQ